MGVSFRKIVNFIIICLICAIPHTNVLAHPLNDTLPVDPDLIKGFLPNGLTYYFRHNAVPEHRVELRLVVKAGAMLEDDDQCGLAHFMEHMNFNGTRNFPKNELVNYLEAIGMKFGADLNATTGYDKTVYVLSVPTDKPENLKKGFRVLEDWADGALLTDKDIDEERGVVLEESRLRKGSQARFRRQIDPLLYNGSLYATRDPIGNDDSLRAFKYSALRRFYADWYRPDLMAIIVVGDIDSSTALTLIKTNFSRLSNPTPERPHFYADMQGRTKPDAVVLVDKEEINNSFSVVFPFKKTKDEITIRDYRENIKKRMLVQLMQTRIHDMFNNNGQNNNISFLRTIHGYEAFQLTAGFSYNGPDQILELLVKSLRQAALYGFSGSEMQLARAAILNRMETMHSELDKKKSSAYIGEMIRNFTENEPIEGIENEYYITQSLLPSISSDDIASLIRDNISTDNIFTYITAADKAGEKMPTADRWLKIVSSDLKKDVPRIQVKVHTTDLLPDKPEKGFVIDKKADKELGVVTYTFNNGVKVTIKPTDFRNDEIKMLGVKKGGKCGYLDKERINCTFAEDLVNTMGYGNFPPNELSRALIGKTANVSLQIGEITDNVHANCDTKDFETMLQLLYLKLTDPRKDDQRFDNWKTNYKRRVDDVYANPQIYFVDTTEQVLYNNDSRYVGIVDAIEIRSLHISKLLHIHKAEFSYADGYYFFITGNIDTTTALPLLETYLGGLPKKEISPAYTDDGLRAISGHHKLIVKRGKESKSMVFVQYYDEVPYTEDLSLNAHTMVDLLNLKITQNLREKMGGIYAGGFSIDVSKEPYPHYGIRLILPCGPENVDKLLAAANNEINSMKENGPDLKDLEKVKLQHIEKHELDIKDNDYWLEQMRNILFFERSPNTLLHYGSLIEKTSPSDIQAAANLLFNGKNEFVSILLPE